MQLKLITAIAILLLAVTSLFVVGCTTPNPSPSPSATTQDTFLENYLTEYKLNRSLDFHINAWELEWTSNTSAHLRWSAVNRSTSQVESWNETFTVFTIQDANNYFNALNKTAYHVASTQYPAGGAYQKTTGHAPQIFMDYIWNEGDPSSISDYTRHEMLQLDYLVVISTGKILG